MHSMTDGATGLRERRMARTSVELTTEARRLTAERGLAGYTVEELCEAVGVSRRTFFNYFPSKEDAVLGLPSRREHPDVEGRFLANGPVVRGARGLSGSLVDDLADLAVARWEVDGITHDDAKQLSAAIDREPRLLARMLEFARAQELGDIALVERREHLPAGDLAAATAVQLMGALLRTTVEEFLTHPDSEPFRNLLLRRLAVARALFPATTDPT
jgi:AcrR family transcriptional regulator